MDLLHTFGFRRTKILHEAFRQGIKAQVVEICEGGQERFYAFRLFRGREKIPFAELRLTEFSATSWLIQDSLEFVRNIIGRGMVDSITESQELPPA